MAVYASFFGYICKDSSKKFDRAITKNLNLNKT